MMSGRSLGQRTVALDVVPETYLQVLAAAGFGPSGPTSTFPLMFTTTSDPTRIITCALWDLGLTEDREAVAASSLDDIRARVLMSVRQGTCARREYSLHLRSIRVCPRLKVAC